MLTRLLSGSGAGWCKFVAVPWRLGVADRVAGMSNIFTSLVQMSMGLAKAGSSHPPVRDCTSHDCRRKLLGNVAVEPGL